MSASEDYEIGLVLHIAKSTNYALLPHESKILVGYISDLHAGIDLGMDILNAEGDHHDNAEALRALDVRAKAIVEVGVRHER